MIQTTGIRFLASRYPTGNRVQRWHRFLCAK